MSNFIEKLECGGIGVFNDLSIEFSPRFNILIGENGVGKTSILKIICLCLNLNGYNRIRFRQGASFMLKAHEGSVLFHYGALNASPIDTQINQGNWPNPKAQPILNNGEIYQGWPARSTYRLFAIGAHRYFNYKQIQGMQREEKGQARHEKYLDNNFTYLDNPSLPDIKQWMINRYFVVEKDWAIYEKMNWERILDYLPQLSPENSKLKFLKIERDLEPVFMINDRECYLEELSSGYKSVLSISFAIVDWIEGVNTDEDALLSNAEGTVLIDEIDVHLHPLWQTKIVKLLKTLFPKIQFIVTAHSPLVISSADKNEVVIIPSNNGSVDVKPQDKEYGSWNSEDIMTHLMGVTILNQDDEKINTVLDKLDNSIKIGDPIDFDNQLLKLKLMASPTDPIIKIYEIKRSELLLNNVKNLPSPNTN